MNQNKTKSYRTKKKGKKTRSGPYYIYCAECSETKAHYSYMDGGYEKYYCDSCGATTRYKTL